MFSRENKPTIECEEFFDINKNKTSPEKYDEKELLKTFFSKDIEDEYEIYIRYKYNIYIIHLIAKYGEINQLDSNDGAVFKISFSEIES